MAMQDTMSAWFCTMNSWLSTGGFLLLFLRIAMAGRELGAAAAAASPLPAQLLRPRPGRGGGEEAVAQPGNGSAAAPLPPPRRQQRPCRPAAPPPARAARPAPANSNPPTRGAAWPALVSTGERSGAEPCRGSRAAVLTDVLFFFMAGSDGRILAGGSPKPALCTGPAKKPNLVKEGSCQVKTTNEEVWEMNGDPG